MRFQIKVNWILLPPEDEPLLPCHRFLLCATTNSTTNIHSVPKVYVETWKTSNCANPAFTAVLHLREKCSVSKNALGLNNLIMSVINPPKLIHCHHAPRMFITYYAMIAVYYKQVLPLKNAQLALISIQDIGHV